MMNITEETIGRLRRTLERYDKLVVEEANHYLGTVWLAAISEPAPDLRPFETVEEVEAELLRSLDEQARARKELADELRRARGESRA
jgi:hypothetical protein